MKTFDAVFLLSIFISFINCLRREICRSSLFRIFVPDFLEMIETKIEYPNGGKIDVYKLVDISASDYKNVFACCDYFAQQGAHVIIYPRFVDTIGNPIYEAIFSSLKGTQYWGKCPDFTVNGVWYEHEGYDITKDLTDRKKRADTFCKMMKRGVKQSDRIIVEDCRVGRFFAKHIIYNRIHFEHQNINEVYIRTDNGLELLHKKQED